MRFIRSNRNAKEVSLGHLVKGVFITALIHQCLELAILDFEQFTRLAEFDDVSGVEDHLMNGSAWERRTNDVDLAYDLVSIHNGLKSVSDREQRHIRSQVGTERILDHRVRLVVDGRSGYEELWYVQNLRSQG